MVAGIFLGVFFLSGFAALLYQTIWQRMLTLFGGVDVYSVTIIVSAFMAGLGVGHLVGGHVADRLTGRQRLVAFAGCELAIALFAVLSATVYYDLLYGRLGAYDLPRVAMGAVVFVVTLWPTFFMGMSLPLASRLLTEDASEPARWVPRLYGWNTVGAACGALFTVRVLFRSLDFRSSLLVGALISLSCGLAALAVGPSLLRRRSALATARYAARAALRPPVSPVPSSGLSVWNWLAVYSLSGFVALSLEIVWFRMLGVTLKSSAFTFGYLLSIYLAGIGLGSLVANSRMLSRLSPVPTFFLLQAAVPAWAALSAGAVIHTVEWASWADPLWRYLGSHDPLSLREARTPIGVAVYGGLPLLFIGPSTCCMGLSFGFLQRAVQTDVRVLGRRVGWLQTANIGGSMAGALLTGVLLLDWLGSPVTLRLLALTGGVFVWLYGRGQPRRRWTQGLAAAVLLLSATLVPGPSTFWARLHGATDTMVIQAEGASGLSTLRTPRPGGETTVFVNGLGESWIPYGGIHTILGALPALLHPNPARIAIIGLGSGDTAFSAGGRLETRVIDSIEILAPQFDTLRQLDRQMPDRGLRQLLNDVRVRHHFTDGRAYLRRSRDAYDIIEADALRPTTAYAGNLYSVEYFSMIRDRLRPDGLAVTWAPTPRVVNSLLRAFPYVTEFGLIAIGSTSAIAFDRTVLEERMGHPFTRDYYLAGGIDIQFLIERHLEQAPVVYGPEFDRASVTDVNRDLFPKDEFLIPLDDSP